MGLGFRGVMVGQDETRFGYGQGGGGWALVSEVVRMRTVMLGEGNGIRYLLIPIRTECFRCAARVSDSRAW